MRHFLTTAVMVLGAATAMATEEAKYNLVEQSGRFELRDYAAHVLAEIVVESDLESAGNIAFGKLFRYISGGNRSHSKIAMTAPVSQEPHAVKLPMTAPVEQQRSGSGWAVSFMMPAAETLETLPTPEDPGITLRPIPPRRMAAVRYSGFWSEASYQQHKAELELWIKQKGLKPAGDAIWARYNPPFTLWFLRRNEILIPVEMPVHP